MGHYVYKYVNDNEIIYIGKNNGDLHKRIRAHGKPGDNIPKEAWPELNEATIYYTELFNANMTDFMESELIRRYKPKWNTAKKEKDWSGLPIGEPEWTLYTPQEKKKAAMTPIYMLQPYTNAKLRALIKRFDEDWERWILLKLIEDAENKYCFEYNELLKTDMANLNISRYFAVYNSFNRDPSLILIDPRKKVYVPTKNKFIMWCTQIYHNECNGDIYAAISKQDIDTNKKDHQESLMYYKTRLHGILDVLKTGYSEKYLHIDMSNAKHRSYRDNDIDRKYELFEKYNDKVMNIKECRVSYQKWS